MKNLVLSIVFLFTVSLNAQMSNVDLSKAQDFINKNNDKEQIVSYLLDCQTKYASEMDKVYYLQGYYQLKIGNNVDALKSFQKSIALNSKFDPAFEGKAKIYNQQKLYNQALESITAAIKINAKVGDYFTLRGKIYTSLGNYNEAVADFNSKIKLDPSDVITYFYAANTLTLKKYKGSAISYFGKAYLIKDIDKCLVDKYYAQYLVSLLKYDEAKAKYISALKNEKLFNAEDYNNLSIVFLKTKNIEKATEYANKAILLNPNEPRYLCSLGSILEEQADWKKLNEVAVLALSLDENNYFAKRFKSISDNQMISLNNSALVNK